GCVGSGAVVYAGSCCLPVCPPDGSLSGKANSCGGTCPCPGGTVVYQGTCCAPHCPQDGTCGGSDGCGGTCGCPGGAACTAGLCQKTCTPACGCGQSCNNGACVPLICSK